MASVGPITLYREKSVIHRFANQALRGAEAPAFVLRSNRLTMEVSAQSRTDTVVVRGHTIASTIRMAGLVAERFTRDPRLFRPDNSYPPDWDALWTRMLSGYERTFNTNIWVSVHVGGDTVFTTKDSPPILAIERMAQGADLDERTVRDATRDLFGATTDTDIVAQHDSQTAVVVTPFSNYLRAAILERKEGRTGSFSISVHHTTTSKVTPHEVLFFAADLIESYNLRQFLDRVPGSGQAQATTPDHLQEHIAAAVTRRNELVQFIDGFETANKVQYRPERPAL